MVFSKAESQFYDIKVTTVGPGYISGENAVQELTAMDLAMKLHYIRAVYYFRSPAFEGLSIVAIKEVIFKWHSKAYIPCGRLRRGDSGRPYIKCNDCGARMIEAKCNMTLDEWLESVDDDKHKLLVPNPVIGPDLPFSPPVFMQLTMFKCGATSVGVSWAHVLGDVFSAMIFMNMWGDATRDLYPAQPLLMAPSHNDQGTKYKSAMKDPLAIKRVDPVGDHWATINDTKIDTYSFYLSWPELTRLQSKICGDNDHQTIPPFESICSVVWQCLAKIKQGSNVNTVTICQRESQNSFEGVLTNKAQSIKVVKTEESVEEFSIMELGLLLMNQGVDERKSIEETMESDGGLADFLLYGANLTFVDLLDAPLYDLDIRGNTPVYVNCVIDNVGDEGVVLVYPARKDQSEGMRVSVTLPQTHLSKLKSMLKKEWSL
ncbi:unnamed protein product [Lactuca saligna]|uniref:Protein ECERIFERUM 26-like n=1 Tax=Lactuca saligna TaxID=75948 RepID=A0AA35VD84_LACSI|nr:unnamed protein product [Lactuca saligna]